MKKGATVVVPVAPLVMGYYLTSYYLITLAAVVVPSV